MNQLNPVSGNDVMYDWRHPIGRTGDLADIIVATLSLASVHHDISKIRFSEFYTVFAQLEKEFPHLIPKLGAKQTGGDTYSKTLGDALENALRIGVRIANPRFQFLEVEKLVGQQNLERFQKRAGEEFIESLKPVAERLATLVGA